ncbi:APC membrane recruitment protein 3 [Dasypus novemcinctus]|uniref:APC membrane recruitment protein 3 n=1 Tax=Dasypus novemcinctus TaxID=9361 RepID=UPI00265EA8DA|nr:APC membrane recruitment protein 3 [Dasypus novemcinctus]XP_004479370.2 APC membrane recruitment protein 3 [Dasypus novemcinctus]XP_004479371.2 APC membrane recruitment protein 3 [Dasypus novemcinctus]
MELQRGKTFIKSSLQLSQDKPPDPATTLAREGPGPWPSLPGQPKPPGEKGPPSSPSPQGHDSVPARGGQPGPEEGPAAPFKLVWKNRMQDCGPGAGRGSAARQLVGSASFPGPPGGQAPPSLCSSQRMIDYRHLAPQMPFVPAVAKSLPRKRISLKRPKKCLRNLFHTRRNKAGGAASPAGRGQPLSPPGGAPGAAGQPGQAFCAEGDAPGPDGLSQDLSDSELPAEAALDLCRALCEDVASLKSFDSLTGCGEIFADESSVPSLELGLGARSPTREDPALESGAPRGPLQGGVEQLASPAQNEAADFATFWDSVNRSVRQQQQQRALLGRWLAGPPGPEADPPRPDAARLPELPLRPCGDPRGDSKASSVDTGTPKSEQPESVSTSDEGYYDSFSPGLEEDKREALSPGTPTPTFPRDSYSGDALFELFCDPSESPAGPGLGDDLCVSESLSGPGLGTPLSMCSFRVGAEENLAPPPGPDLLSQSFLQSSWRGKECLLKLCDTELAITMGIVNWLRRGPGARAPPAAAPPSPPRAPRAVAERLGVGSRGAGPCTESPEGKGAQPSITSQVAVCSAPSGQEPWVRPGPRSPVQGENQAPTGGEWVARTPSRGSPLEQGSQDRGARGCGEASFLAGSAAAVRADTSSQNKVPSSSARPCSQEPRSLVSPGAFPDPWQPGPGGSILGAESSLVGCVAQVAALQLLEDRLPPAEWTPRQDADSRHCRRPRAGGPDVPQQTEPSSPPRGAAARGQPSPASVLHNAQAQRCADHAPGLGRLRTQASASTEGHPLQLSPGAAGQGAPSRQLDIVSPCASPACPGPRAPTAAVLDRASPARAPERCCSLPAHRGVPPASQM